MSRIFSSNKTSDSGKTVFNPEQIKFLTIYVSLLVFGLFIIHCTRILNAPFGRDQGIFSWQALMMENGGFLYRDAWDHKGPLGAIIYYLLGGQPLAIDIFDLTFLALTLFLVCLSSTCLIEGLVKSLFLLVTLHPVWWGVAQPDLLGAEMMLISMVLLGRSALKTDIVAALLLGATVLFKPNFGIFVLAMWGYVFVRDRAARTLKNRIAYLFFLGLMSIIPLIVFCAYAFFNGFLTDVIDAVFVFNIYTHHAVLAHPMFSPYLFFYPTFLASSYMFWLQIFLYCLIFSLFIQKKYPKELFFLAAALIVLFSQTKFFYYHYFPVFAVTGYLAGAGWGACMHRRDTYHLVKIGLFFILGYASTVGLATFANQAETYEKNSEGFSVHDVGESIEKIKELTQPDDYIYLWGWDASLYALSGRRSSTRYGFSYPLRVGDPSVRRATMLSEMHAHPPKLIIVQRKDKNSLLTVTSEDDLLRFPELKALIDGAYHFIWQNNHFAFYQINENGMPKP